MTTDERPGREQSGLWVVRGAQAAQQALLDEIVREAEAGRREPRLLARPVRIVVSSRSLREHLLASIAGRCGAVAGVVVQTLQALAFEVMERGGDRAEDGDVLFPILARRALLAEPAWRAALADFDDGAAAAIGTLADLLDAGLTHDHLDPALEALADGAGSGSEGVARAQGIVRAAARVGQQLEVLGRMRRSDRLARAQRLLVSDPALLPARSVWIHGFADATGIALDLLQQLVRGHGARLLLDRPCDPATRKPDAAAERFTSRLAERIERIGSCHEVSVSTDPPRLAAFDAPGVDAEMRGVARRIRRLIDDTGVSPEAIGVVARRLDPCLVSLRRHCTRLGIPFSTNATAPPGERARRASALAALLRDGGQTRIDAVLDALCLDPAERPDLRVAMHAIGVSRLGDVVGLDLARLLDGSGGLRLPVPRGLATRAREDNGDAVTEAEDSDAADAQETDADPDLDIDHDGGAGGAQTPRRRRQRFVPAGALARCVDALARTAASLSSAPDLARRSDEICAEVSCALDVLALAPEVDRVASALLDEARRGLDALSRALPASFAITRAELAQHLSARLLESTATPAGGLGAGVQVLDAMAARSRTFSHLFVVGLQRDAFPRIVREDPLLSDELRARLRRLRDLDLARKEVGHDEERWLFAQLLSAAPNVVLSWQRTGDDGRPKSRSPFVERLLLADRTLVPVAEPALLSLAAREHGPRTAYEHALFAALHDGRGAFEALLPLALVERAEYALATEPGDGDATLDVSHSRELARARLEVLREIDPSVPAKAGVGPWMGFVGAVHSPDDPRGNPLYVTTVEKVARCGWRFFLEKCLGLEPPPDALHALPGIDPLVLGNVVHRTLERWAVAHGIASQARLGDAVASGGIVLPAPDLPALADMIRVVATEVLGEPARIYPGIVEAVANHARTAFDALFAAESVAPPAAWLGVEVHGACVFPSEHGTFELGFKADLVTRTPDKLHVIDVKTGSARGKADLAKDFRRGVKLQSAAYQVAAQRLDPTAVATYLHVSSKGEGAKSVEIGAPPDLAIELEEAVLTSRAALEQGALVPRLLDGDDIAPRACKSCEVADACSRFDSSVRMRLARWAREPLREDASGAEATAHALFWLGREEAP